MIAPPISSPLAEKIDIDIICGVRDAHGAAPVYAVRWATRPDLPFPSTGYKLERLDGNQFTEVGRFALPPSTGWPALEAELRRRRLRSTRSESLIPAAAITPENFAFLLPLLQLLEGQPPTSLLEVIAFFNNSHHGNEDLAPEIRELPILLTANDLSQVKPADLPALELFYARQATGFLMGLASRFEFAVLLGLATDDPAADPNSAVIYRVSLESDSASSSSTRVGENGFVNAGNVAPPTNLRGARVPGTVTHPIFQDAFGGWRPAYPASISPEEQQVDDRRPPRVPAHYSALTWDPPQAPNRLLTTDAVLYRVERFDHGAASVTLPAPPIPVGSSFTEIEPGELALMPENPPHYVDRHGMDWPPHEGYVSYRVWAVGLLGTESLAPAETWVRHLDDLKPVPPRITLVGDAARTWSVSAGKPIDVDLSILWEAPEDFMGPDATEFRFSLRWTARLIYRITTLSVTPLPIAKPTDIGKYVIAVDGATGPAENLKGARLLLPSGEFVISHEKADEPWSLVVFPSGGDIPGSGEEGCILAADTPTAPERVATVNRRPTVSGWLRSVTQADGKVTLLVDNASTTALPATEGENGVMYLHAVRRSFPVVLTGGAWSIAADAQDAGVVELLAFAASAKGNWLIDSPVLFFPAHAVTISMRPPLGYRSGTLEVLAMSADSARYQGVGPFGNESDPAGVSIVLRCIDPPPAPATSRKRFWAKSAAVFAETAEASLAWGDADAALRYEVWRALEGALGASEGSPDDDLFTLAGIRLPAGPNTFELASGAVFGTRFIDTLPGRAPTRALYRIRAITAEGVAGPHSDFIGPVYVPDIRQPAAPNLISVAPPAAPGDRAMTESRCLDLIWTQPGATDDVEFEVDVSADGKQWQTLSRIPWRDARGAASVARLPDDRLKARIHGITPGRLVNYRVRAVRSALDPIDPLWRERRDIESEPSLKRAARATGALVPPRNVRADVYAGEVVVTWVDGDVYDSVQIGRRLVGEPRFVWGKPISASSRLSQLGILAAGTWEFVVRGSGGSRAVTSAVFRRKIE